MDSARGGGGEELDHGGIKFGVEDEVGETGQLQNDKGRRESTSRPGNHKMEYQEGEKGKQATSTAHDITQTIKMSATSVGGEAPLEAQEIRKETPENTTSTRKEIDNIEILPISAESRSTTTKTLVATPTIEPKSPFNLTTGSEITTTTPDTQDKSNSQSWTAKSSTFVLSKNKKKWLTTNENTLKNSLLVGVGFLELANAGDFAANVWNQIPVPTFAAVLMGLGGTFALWISIFAFTDILLARKNYILLKKERALLKAREESQERNTYLAVNFRELGTEIIDRIGMDAFMGFGAVMVGVGTLLAIGGANPKVYHASNLLSGYIGNSPVALFGLFNAFWSLFIITRAEHHRRYARKSLNSVHEKDILGLLSQRTRRVQSHAAIMGVVGIVGGGASLVTSEHWEGYPILIPCIILSAYCNWVWRTRVGYSRPLNDFSSSPIENMTEEALIEEVGTNSGFLETCRRSGKNKVTLFDSLVEESDSMVSILEFLVRHGLFTSFCLRILKDETLTKSVFGNGFEEKNEIEISPEIFLVSKGKACFLALKDVAEKVVKEEIEGRSRHRERFLLETLGCYLVEVKRRRKCEKKGRGDVEMEEK